MNKIIDWYRENYVLLLWELNNKKTKLPGVENGNQQARDDILDCQAGQGVHQTVRRRLPVLKMDRVGSIALYIW